MQAIIGLDIGTTSVSLVVINAGDGSTLLTRVTPNESRMPDDEPGAYIQDPEKILFIARSLVRDARDRYGNAESIGVSGQMHGIVLVDHKGKAVSPVYTWLDMRGTHIGSDGITHVSALEQLTGETILPGYGAATLYALSRTESIPDTAKTFCTVTDYVAMNLAGGSVPVMEPSLAHSLGLFDSGGNTFQTDLWRKITNLEPPAVVPSTTVIGQFDATVPLTAAVGDNQAGFLASVRDTRKGIHINIGTSGQVSFISGETGASNSVLDARPFPTGETLMVGASLTGGKSFDILTGLIREIGNHIHSDPTFNPYSILDDFGTPPEEMDLPVVETTFKGTRTDPGKTGSIRGITLENFTIGGLFWGFAAGIVEELYRMIEHHRAVLEVPGFHVVASGNAVKKNKVLRRTIVRRFNSPVIFLRDQESAARGAAMIGFAGRHGGASVLSKLAQEMIVYDTMNLG